MDRSGVLRCLAGFAADTKQEARDIYKRAHRDQDDRLRRRQHSGGGSCREALAGRGIPLIPMSRAGLASEERQVVARLRGTEHRSRSVSGAPRCCGGAAGRLVDGSVPTQ